MWDAAHIPGESFDKAINDPVAPCFCVPALKISL